MNTSTNLPNAPRWINTEAGQAAWREHPAWRSSAFQALSVQERMRLLDEADRLHQQSFHQYNDKGAG
jgi:hypothetical protein